MKRFLTWVGGILVFLVALCFFKAACESLGTEGRAEFSDPAAVSERWERSPAKRRSPKKPWDWWRSSWRFPRALRACSGLGIWLFCLVVSFFVQPKRPRPRKPRPTFKPWVEQLPDLTLPGSVLNPAAAMVANLAPPVGDPVAAHYAPAPASWQAAADAQAAADIAEAGAKAARIDAQNAAWDGYFARLAQAQQHSSHANPIQAADQQTRQSTARPDFAIGKPLFSDLTADNFAQASPASAPSPMPNVHEGGGGGGGVNLGGGDPGAAAPGASGEPGASATGGAGGANLPNQANLDELTRAYSSQGPNSPAHIPDPIWMGGVNNLWTTTANWTSGAHTGSGNDLLTFPSTAASFTAFKGHGHW